MNTQNLEPVGNFNLDRYMGLWYEIARYTHWFEKDMTDVTAEYVKEEGYVRIINKGKKEGKQKVTNGKAFYDSDKNIGKLRVSFFGPFKSDYLIIRLDSDYQWAIVSDYKKTTLWILARNPQIDKQLLSSFIEWLKGQGFDESKICYTVQTD